MQEGTAIGELSPKIRIPHLTADAHRIIELGCLHFFTRRAGLLHTKLGRDVLLDDREFSTDAPAFADVRILRQPVLGANDIRPQAHALPARAAVRPGRFGLQPVEQSLKRSDSAFREARACLAAWTHWALAMTAG